MKRCSRIKKEKSDLRLEEAGELSLIRVFERLFRPSPKGVILGIGDDASVVSVDGRKTIITTDSMVEGVHFSLRLAGQNSGAAAAHTRSTLLRSVAHRAIASCLSDIAAMGGRPLYGVVSLGLPGSFLFQEAVLLARTMRDVSRKFGGSIVGGDTVESDALFISATFIGATHGGKFVTRGGGRPGDVVLVTGELGDSATGLALIKKAEVSGGIGLEPVRDHDAGSRRLGPRRMARLSGLVPELRRLGETIGARAIEKALRKHLFPEPRFEEGRIACGNGATSMIDISDGLATELDHLACSSSVQIEIDSALVPIGAASVKVGAHFGRDPLAHALFGGEEYELLFTAPIRKALEISEAITSRTGTKVTRIGVVKKGKPKVTLREEDSVRPLRPSGYEHFSSSYRR
ncbi:MAG: thiamine-phosphate kinase [Candidatus Eisenbacteria bacterium]|nr:thiamine-phosphate kinase [Candidatus Eisenbacteria bacterium]